MEVVRTANAAEFAAAAADWVADHLREKPQSVLALPTGSTPIGLYAELVRRSRAGSVSLDEARIFNLDEYCGVAPTNPHSYAAFINEHVTAPLRLADHRVCLLRGDAEDLHEECQRYDAALDACGGVDLCILGLGVNGHIAFNEPGSAWHLRTHVVCLSQATRRAHADLSPRPWTIPECGVTMGIGSLSGARHVLLLIAGANKENARRALHRGVADAQWPVTSLLTHPSMTTIELYAP